MSGKHMNFPAEGLELTEARLFQTETGFFLQAKATWPVSADYIRINLRIGADDEEAIVTQNEAVHVENPVLVLSIPLGPSLEANYLASESVEEVTTPGVELDPLQN